MKNIKKSVFYLILIVILGAAGGVMADRLLFPYLASLDIFSSCQFVQNAGNGTTIINPTQQIVITENQAIEQAIDKVRPVVVFIESYSNTAIIAQGTGMVVTADGYILTANSNVPARATQYRVYRNNHYSAAQVIKRDGKQDLALLKIDEPNLPVAPFAPVKNLKLGQRAVLVGADVIEGELSLFVNLAFIRTLTETNFTLNLTSEAGKANGSVLVSDRYEIVGIGLVNSSGQLLTLPADILQKFIRI